MMLLHQQCEQLLARPCAPPWQAMMQLKLATTLDCWMLRAMTTCLTRPLATHDRNALAEVLAASLSSTRTPDD